MALSLFGSACDPDEAPARAQWVVVIGTDASVPQFGDRLLVEILDSSGEAACDGCRRQLTAASASAWPLSFGIVPKENGDSLWIRATLYRTDHTGNDGLPQGLTHIEALGQLPQTDSLLQVGLELRMDCFGVPTDFGAATSCDPATGTSAPIAVLREIGSAVEMVATDSWPAAQPVDCSGALPDGMVCVPGGVFLLGGLMSLAFSNSTEPEHLTKLSPYALDANELTVGELRQLVLDGTIDSLPLSQDPDPKAKNGACTYDGGNDALPVNCINRDLARAACEAQGKRLPTEAEWEFAAGNRTRETSYSWGEDDDVCAHAVVARGRGVLELNIGIPDHEEVDVCRAASSEEVLPWGPVANDAGDDVTDLGLRHMSGNLSEWVADAVADYDDPCWNPGSHLLVDPICTVSTTTSSNITITRGGRWTMLPFLARVVERNAVSVGNEWLGVGVRCAQSM